MATTADTSEATEGEPPKKRSRVLQSDVPAYPLRQALTVAEALRDQFGKQPASALMLAKALDLSPGSSTFRMLTGAAVAYGLTDAGGYANRIGLTDLGRRAVAPTEEGDDLVALREAALTPRVPKEFLTKYDNNRVPNEKIALNVIEEMGVPAGDNARRALEMTLANAEDLDLIEVVKGNRYVNLDRVQAPVPGGGVADPDEEDEVPPPPSNIRHDTSGARPVTPGPATLTPQGAPAVQEQNNRVFVSHGKNREIVAQLKEVLTFGGFEPVVSVETETAAKPVPDKVLDDMRSCSAGIVHVGHERTLLDSQGAEQKVLNSNVLIEIGAALALYRGRLILLVEEGTELPSNLQGLYQARFAGGKLDYDSTMKLLRTFNEFRSKS